MGVSYFPKYHMLLYIIPKLISYKPDAAFVLLTYLNNHIALKMINDCIFVYSLVSNASTLDHKLLLQRGYIHL